MHTSEFIPKWMPGLFSEAAPQELREELASIMSDFHPIGYRLMALSSAGVDTRDLLPNIRVPTLLVWGEEDERAPLTVARQFHDAIPGARLVTIPGAGHVSNLEQPALFNVAVRNFCLSLEAE
jgi:pimeloyl-ACP methyl ester carboxylesterase